MSIHEEAVEKMAKLAGLRLTPEQTKAFTQDLSKILELVDQMTSTETDHIQPLSHPHDGIQALREDQVTETNQRELFQSLAPKVESGLYLVPKVIES